MSMFHPMHERIPTGEAGRVRIEHYDVSEQEAELTKIRMFMGAGDWVPPGRYCRLMVNGAMMMSDTPFEQNSNREFVRRAKGDVLVAGLGIGLVLVPVLAKELVTSVTVIEKHREVIELVQPHLHHDKLRVHLADIFTWRPPRGAKWDTIYFDIWPDICVDNLEEITKLKRKFARRKRPGGWMGAWQESHLRSCQRRGTWR